MCRSSRAHLVISAMAPPLPSPKTQRHKFPSSNRLQGVKPANLPFTQIKEKPIEKLRVASDFANTPRLWAHKSVLYKKLHPSIPTNAINIICFAREIPGDEICNGSELCEPNLFRMKHTLSRFEPPMENLSVSILTSMLWTLKTDGLSLSANTR
jgi:hypothetical protein